METIVLEVPFDVAQQFNALLPSEKNIIVAFLKAWMNPNKTKDISPSKKLLESMDAVSKTAIERGMTEEILNNILEEASFYESEKHNLAVKKLLKTVETIGLNATKRGMTDEILEDILNEN